MPRHPHHSTRAESVLEGGFGRAPVTAHHDLTRLHIGDSAEPPGPEFPLSAELSALSRWWYRYPAPAGTGRLRRAIAEFYSTHHRIPTEAAQILVAPGATSALNTLVHLLCDAGEEVIVPTPVWPLFPKMSRLAGVRVREVPLHDAVPELDATALAGRIEEAVGPDTVMLYLNTPNNPSGSLMDVDQCRAVLQVARRHGLWVVSDEAYDSMAFDGRSTPSLATIASDDDRVLVVSTFSKMHRAAGLRLGWLRASAALAGLAVRVATFQVYSASALAQELAEPAIRTREEWAGRVLADLQERRDRFWSALDLDAAPPAGAYFCFLDLRRWQGPDADGARAAHELLQEGVSVTPGVEFGQGYEGWIRACFASESADRTEDAARRIGRWIRSGPSRTG